MTPLENLGTQIKIELPGARPDWASSQINLEGIEKVVILNDDKSIHQIWTERLKAKIPVTHKFTSAKKLMKNVDQFGRKTLFLLDYELRGQKETGLDIARDLGEDNPCYLVTNSFQDPLIQRECKRLGAGVIAKNNPLIIEC